MLRIELHPKLNPNQACSHIKLWTMEQELKFLYIPGLHGIRFDVVIGLAGNYMVVNCGILLRWAWADTYPVGGCLLFWRAKPGSGNSHQGDWSTVGNVACIEHLLITLFYLISIYKIIICIIFLNTC